MCWMPRGRPARIGLIVVVGFKAEVVQSALAHHRDVEFALQEQQQGTGHAVMMCRDQLANYHGPVLVVTGDTPLLRGMSLRSLLDEQRKVDAACVVGTAETEQNQGLGRIVRDGDGAFVRIVEHNDATEKELAITEINTGCFAFDNRALFEALDQVRPDNNQGEYYLTDCAEILRTSGRTVVAALQTGYRRGNGGQHARAACRSGICDARAICRLTPLQVPVGSANIRHSPIFSTSPPRSILPRRALFSSTGAPFS